MTETVRKPNIVFFFTDDQRFDTISILGNQDVLTPTMDWFVRQGTTFTNAYIMGGSCPAVCMPSRAMLMTGRTLYHLADSGRYIPAEHALLGEVLQQAGYATFGTGKWHNGPDSYARSFSAGARIFFGGMDDHWNVPVADYDPTGQYPEEARKKAPNYHSSTMFADAAVEFLRDYQEDRPFFAYVSFMAPHDPRTMPQRFRDLYDPKDIRLPDNYLPEHPFDNGELRIRDELLAGFPRTPQEIRRHMAEYYAMITHLDAEIGRVVDALKQTAHLENTIIVFAGDNGLAVGRHGLMGKQNMYDHSLHVPLIFLGPGVPENVRSQSYCYLLDIFPTLCDLVGVEIPESVEGQSLLPAMRQPEQRVRDTLLFAYKDCQRAVQDDRFKLIEYVVNGQRTTQLFDLREDPVELHDLADDPAYAGHVQRLRQALRRWPEELGDQTEQGQTFWGGYDAGA